MFTFWPMFKSDFVTAWVNLVCGAASMTFQTTFSGSAKGQPNRAWFDSYHLAHERKTFRCSGVQTWFSGATNNLAVQDKPKYNGSFLQTISDSVIFFGSTSLPLSFNRWLRSTIKHCAVHSLSSALSINLSNVKSFRKCQKSNPGPLGAKRKRYLCAMRPPQIQ